MIAAGRDIMSWPAALGPMRPCEARGKRASPRQSRWGAEAASVPPHDPRLRGRLLGPSLARGGDWCGDWLWSRKKRWPSPSRGRRRVGDYSTENDANRERLFGPYGA